MFLPFSFFVHVIYLEPFHRCDFGYEGKSCAQSSRVLPTMFIDDISHRDTMTSHFAVMRGLVHDYTCGVVASGKALVFNQNGRRELQTMDMDSSGARYNQKHENHNLVSQYILANKPQHGPNSEPVFYLKSEA